MGGKGFISYSRFYDDNLDIQRKFLRHVFNKRYYENYTRVEPFLAPEDLVVSAKPCLPAYFTTGHFIVLFYLALVYCLNFIFFKRYLYPRAEYPDGYEEVVIESGSGCVDMINAEKEDLENQVYNIYSGYPRDFNGQVTLDGNNIVNGEEKDFVFIPPHDKIPGHFTVAFLIHNLGKLAKVTGEELKKIKNEKKIQLKKRYSRLEPWERTILLMDLGGLKGTKIYITGSLGLNEINWPKIFDKISRLKEKGTAIIGFSDAFYKTDHYHTYQIDLKGKKYEIPGDHL